MNSSKRILTLLVIITIFSITPLFSQWEVDTVISTGSNTTGIAITSDGSKLVVTNNTAQGSVEIISTSDYLMYNVDISSIEGYPNGVVITPNDSTALVCTTHYVIFIDLNTHSIKGSFPAPCSGTTLYGIAVTPNGHNAIFPDLSSSCIQQGVRSIDATGLTAGSSFIPVSTTGQLYGITVAQDGNSALVTTFTFDSPKKINLSTAEVDTIAGISASYGVAAFHKTNEALIFDGDSLDRVSLASNSVIKKISYLSYNVNFESIAITADDKYAFAVGSYEKLIISLANDSVMQTFSTGGTNIATMPDGSRFFVTDSYNGNVRVYKNSTITGVRAANNPIPITFSLQQNYPNPFNPSTNIPFSLPSKAFVSLKVFNLIGEEVTTLINEELPAGVHLHTWNADGIPSGVYFYRLQAGSFLETKKLILLK